MFCNGINIKYNCNILLKKKSLFFFNFWTYFLENSLNINYNIYTNKLCINMLNIYLDFFLPSVVFFKQRTNILSFLFLKKNLFFSFLKNFFLNYNRCKKIYFFRIKLKGLGFFLRRISLNLLCIFMAVNHFFFFHLPKNIYLKKKKKHLLFLSNNLVKLNNVFWNLMFLKKHSAYVKIRGISGFIKPNYIRFIKKKNKL